MLFHYASFLRRTYLTSLFYHRPTALLHMTFTKLVYTLRISGLLLSWHFLYWGSIIRWAVALLFGYNQVSYHESGNCTFSSFVD